MNQLKARLIDTVPGQLWQGISLHGKTGGLPHLLRGGLASLISNIIVWSAVWIVIIGLIPVDLYGLILVAMGAITLAYVALRVRIHSLDYVQKAGRFKSPQERKTYFRGRNALDSLIGFFLVLSGFVLRILYSGSP